MQPKRKDTRMASPTKALPQPSASLVDAYIHQFDTSQVVVEQALAKLFAAFPRNTALDEVLLKVVSLNDIYRTGILATYKVAEQIHQSNIDPLLAQGDPEVVHRIAHVTLGAKVRNNYSFATKYCAWHNRDTYPIYDSFVDGMLWAYQNRDRFAKFRRYELWRYHTFVDVIGQFRAFYSLQAYSLTDLDKFLWLAGKEHYPAAWSSTSSLP
jgi:hypothetical protein